MNLFEQFGPVRKLWLPINHVAQRPMGFGFLELDDQAAIEAIRRLDGTVFMGRTIRVSEARPKKEQ